MYNYGKTIDKLHAMLKLHEKGIPKKAETPAVLAIREGKIQKDKRKLQGVKGKDKGKNKLAYAPKPKISPWPKRDNLTKDSICHHCKEVGHWRRNCPSYQTDLKKRKNASMASTSGIFTIELYAFPNKTWVYDTGCGTHICNTSQGLRGSKKLKHGALSLYMGNGMRAAVEAIGSFDLILPSGLIIVFDNCHFAPNVTRGVVLISRLVENGYIHTFTNYGISVTKYNVFYFNAIPHDGIYEIDMHNLYPNDSSTFNVSNKSRQFIGILLFYGISSLEASGSHGLLEASESDEGLELNQEDDIQPSENTSEIHNVVVRAEEYELGDLNKPPNYKAALSDPEYDKWLEAMNTKMQSMKDNQVWWLVDLPPNGRTVRKKWLFKKKTDMDGNVHTFKARIVAKGYTQTYSVYYRETFSPVADIRAIRILLAIVAFFDYEIW
ncbi:zinc finger, CCHC-type containing protein [Tanacetum coccineum]